MRAGSSKNNMNSCQSSRSDPWPPYLAQHWKGELVPVENDSVPRFHHSIVARLDMLHSGRDVACHHSQHHSKGQQPNLEDGVQDHSCCVVVLCCCISTLHKKIEIFTQNQSCHLSPLPAPRQKSGALRYKSFGKWIKNNSCCVIVVCCCISTCARREEDLSQICHQQD